MWGPTWPLSHSPVAASAAELLFTGDPPAWGLLSRAPQTTGQLTDGPRGSYAFELEHELLLAAPPWHLPTQTLCGPGTWWRAPRPLLRAARRPHPGHAMASTWAASQPPALQESLSQTASLPTAIPTPGPVLGEKRLGFWGSVGKRRQGPTPRPTERLPVPGLATRIAEAGRPHWNNMRGRSNSSLRVMPSSVVLTPCLHRNIPECIQLWLSSVGSSMMEKAGGPAWFRPPC